jgi:hypothetical protein
LFIVWDHETSWLVGALRCAVVREYDSCAGKPAASSAVISAPPDPAFPGAVDSMAGDRTTLVNMDRNHDLRLTDRRPRRAKDFEPELSRGSGFEFEIIRFTH